MTAYLLNLCDLALTLYAIPRGGVELNPLLQDPAVMVAYKVVGVGVLCAVLEVLARPSQSRFARQLSRRESRVARWGLRVGTAVYAALCIYHLYFILGGMIL